MAAHVIQLLNLFLLFRLVLGCEFRKNRALIAAGAVLTVVWAAVQVMGDGMHPVYVYTEFLLYIFIPACFFSGRFWSAAGISAILYQAAELVESLVTGVGIILEDGKTPEVNLGFCYLFSMLAVTAVLCVTGRAVKESRSQIYAYLQELNPALFIPAVIFMYILQLGSGYSSEIDMDMVQIISAIHMSKNGLMGIFTLLILILLCVNRFQKRKLEQEVSFNKKCIEKQTEQYQLIGRRDQQLRKFRHDFSKHMSVLQRLSKAGAYEKLDEYLQSLGDFSEGFHFLSTQNLICDAIVNQYYGLCRKEGISVSVLGKIDGSLLVPESDLCVMLSNAFENALEAVKACPGEQDREISLKIKREGNFLFFEMRNPSPAPLKLEDGFPVSRKTDRQNHGIGTRNMRETAARNGGEVFWEEEGEGRVLTRIILPCEIKN